MICSWGVPLAMLEYREIHHEHGMVAMSILCDLLRRT